MWDYLKYLCSMILFKYFCANINALKVIKPHMIK